MQREEQEQMRLLKKMPLRQQRSYLRKLERGDEVPELNEEDFEDSDFDFGSDFDSDFEDEDDDDERNDQEKKTTDAVDEKLSSKAEASLKL